MNRAARSSRLLVWHWLTRPHVAFALVAPSLCRLRSSSPLGKGDYRGGVSLCENPLAPDCSPFSSTSPFSLAEPLCRAGEFCTRAAIASGVTEDRMNGSTDERNKQRTARLSPCLRAFVPVSAKRTHFAPPLPRPPNRAQRLRMSAGFPRRASATQASRRKPQAFSPCLRACFCKRTHFAPPLPRPPNRAQRLRTSAG